METNAQLAAKLLRNAANFFRDVAIQNPSLKGQMDVNADTYEVVADLVEKSPTAEIPQSSARARK